MLSECSLLDNCKKGCAGETGLFPYPDVCPGASRFPSVCPSFLTCKRRRSKMVSNILANLPSLSFLDLHEPFQDSRSLTTFQHSGKGGGCWVSPQRLTCPSHAMTASQSAGVASGPPELQLSTRRTGSHWSFLGNLGRGPGQWWRCVQPLHKGLGAENRRG